MNPSRSAEVQIPSPTTGIRARIGHVVRWHAEPVNTESARDSRDAADAIEIQSNGNAPRPL